MRKIKNTVAIITGMAGFFIAPSDSLLQAAVGVSLLAFGVWLGSLDSDGVYREAKRISDWIDRNIFRYNSKHPEP
jgi:hypothetical protein